MIDHCSPWIISFFSSIDIERYADWSDLSSPSTLSHSPSFSTQYSSLVKKNNEWSTRPNSNWTQNSSVHLHRFEFELERNWTHFDLDSHRISQIDFVFEDSINEQFVLSDRNFNHWKNRMISSHLIALDFRSIDFHREWEWEVGSALIFPIFERPLSLIGSVRLAKPFYHLTVNKYKNSNKNSVEDIMWEVWLEIEKESSHILSIDRIWWLMTSNNSLWSKRQRIWSRSISLSNWWKSLLQLFTRFSCWAMSIVSST